MRERRILVRSSIGGAFFLALGLLLLGGRGFPGQGEVTQASHSASAIDRLSIDMETAGNGAAAVGDRDGDGLVDAEGAPPAPSGTCGNGLDDDHDGGTTAFPDTVPDDGCVQTLSVRQTCANINNNNILDADEDLVDRIILDVTVGVQPGTAPGVPGGIPADRAMTAFQFDLNWDNDVIDVISRNSNFLITKAGTGQPFNSFVVPGLPAPTSPITIATADSGPSETGAGVLSRVTIEGNAPGVANLSLNNVDIRDSQNETIPVTSTNFAFVTVDSPGACVDTDGDGVIDSADNCPGTVNPLQQNFDGDALGDACDPDVDGDGVANGPDVCPFTSVGSTVDAAGCAAAQVDGDGDGICNPGAPSAGPAPGCTGSDNCPSDANSGQQNFDQDSLGDACDPDDDNDGLPDATEPPGCSFDADCDNDTVLDNTDNCITTINANQANFDGDALGDACDPDDDNDTIADASDQCQFVAEDLDGVDDTDGCQETDSRINTVTAEGGFVAQQNVPASHNVSLNVSNNGNLTASLQVTLVLRSTVGQCEARWQATPPDSVFDSVIGTNLFSQLEHTEAAVQAGLSRNTTQSYTINCFQSPGFYDNAVRLQIGVAPVLPMRENSGAGADNAYSQFVDVTVGQPSDIKVTLLSVPNPTLQVGVPQNIIVSSTLHNNGPFGPTDVMNHLTATAPADCTVSPPGYDTPTTLPVSVDVVLNNTFSVQCNQPSFHAFTFSNQVDVTSPSVADPTPANNFQSTQPTLAVLAAADLEVTSASMIAPPSQAANATFAVTVDSTLHNNGPYGPASANAVFALSVPADCTKTPPGTQTAAAISLATSISSQVQRSWNVACTQPSDHQYSGTVSLSAVDPHVSDASPANNSQNNVFDGSITVSTDVQTTAMASNRDDLAGVPGIQILVGPLPPVDPLPESEGFTLSETLRNNGPFGPVSVSVTHNVTDVPSVCVVTPNPQQSFVNLPVVTNIPHSEPFSVQWLDDPQPPQFCTITVSKTVTIATQHVTDPNMLNNSTQLSLDVVRDSDADGVPDDYTANGGPRDNCPNIANLSQSDLDVDGVGDACDSQPYHDDFISGCVGFGPAPITLSDTDGAYMSINCNVTNDSDNGNTLPGHADTVTLSSSVTGFPSGCDATPTFPNSGIQTTLVSPGSATFVLLDDETRPVLLRIRFECHTAAPNVYPVLVSLIVDHQDTGGGDEAPAQQVNNTGSVPKNVILVAPNEPTADAKTVATSLNTPVVVTLTGSDFQTCQLTFATANASNGTLGAITNNACASGAPNTDSASVTFTPTTGVCSPQQGSFTYTVNDGLAASLPATVTVNITC